MEQFSSTSWLEKSPCLQPLPSKKKGLPLQRQMLRLPVIPTAWVNTAQKARTHHSQRWKRERYIIIFGRSWMGFLVSNTFILLVFLTYRSMLVGYPGVMMLHPLATPHPLVGQALVRKLPADPPAKQLRPLWEGDALAQNHRKNRDLPQLSQLSLLGAKKKTWPLMIVKWT